MKRSLHFIIGMSVMLLLGACANPQKLIDDGDFDSAIEIAAKRLSGKKKKKHKYVVAIEDAYRKVTEQDLHTIQILKKEGRPENWEKIDRIYRDIKERQDLIRPFLPLVDEDGYQASFKFVKADELSIESRKRMVEYLYGRAQELLERASTTGDRDAAREAYDELDKIDAVYTSYRETDRLKDEAIFLGTEKWIVKVANETEVFLPDRFEYALLQMDVGDINQRWRRYDLSPQEGIKYDYTATLRIHQIDVSAEREKERQYDESKEIEDGFDYVLDENGNVMKDSSGNDIKVPRKVFIKATVLEVFQNKYAIVGGLIDIKDNWSGDIIYSEPTSVEVAFENYASTLLGGDQRALTKDTRSRLGNDPKPFPPDEVMLLDAAELLKDKVKYGLRRYRS